MSTHRQHYPCPDLRAQLRTATRRTNACRLALTLAYCAALVVLFVELVK